MSQHKFIREDNGEEIFVDYATMMEKDSLGCITLEDGTIAKEDRSNWKRKVASTEDKNEEHYIRQTQFLSDSMGFPAHQYVEVEADRRMMGFDSIEFVKEPDIPFYQVKGESGKEWNRYMKHRGFFDKNRHDKGYTLSPKEIQDAERAVKERYGEP